MVKYCLKCAEIARFLAVEILGNDLYDDEAELRDLLDMARVWGVELICLTNLLSITLDGHQKGKIDTQRLLDEFYSLPGTTGINLIFDELDHNFVDHMLQFNCPDDLSLEEKLCHIRQKMSDNHPPIEVEGVQSDAPISERQRFVLDTTALISSYPEIFGGTPKISQKSVSLIHRIIEFADSALLTIPSVVFVEIYDKWLSGNKHLTEELMARFRAEIYYPIQSASNIEIRELDQEILEKFLMLNDQNIKLENHDKIILATASTLEATLITSDRKIIRFNNRYNVVPDILT